MEYWDIYDVHEVPTGQVLARGEPFGRGQFHLVVNVCLFNSRGQLLIQQRQSTKQAWPDLWDLSVDGNAVAGEASWQAAERETAEELGLRLDLSAVRPHLTLRFAQGFTDLYLIRREVEPSRLVLQKEEVQAVRWAGLDEVLSMIEAGTFIPYYPSLIRLLFDMEGKYGYLC